MNNTKFFLAFTLFCMMPIHSMDNDGTPPICGLELKHMGIKTTEEQQKLLLQKKLESTFVTGSFIPFDYLDKKTDLGADILEAIAQGTKNYAHDTAKGKQIIALDSLVNTHRANVTWCNSLLGRAWRFITFKGRQKIDGKLQLSLVQEKILWQLVSQRTGTPKTSTLVATATTKLRDLQLLGEAAEQLHHDQINAEEQIEEIATYKCPEVHLNLPNTHVSPLIDYHGSTTHALDLTPKYGHSVVPNIQCSVEDNNLNIFDATIGHAATIKSCNPQQFDISDKHVAVYGDHNGKKQLKVYARPSAKPRYEIPQDGKSIKPIQNATVGDFPCWTQQVPNGCTALALWQHGENRFLAYAEKQISGSVLNIQKLPIPTLPIAQSVLGRLFTLVAYINIFKNRSNENNRVPESLFQINDNTNIIKVAPTADDNILLLNDRGEVHNANRLSGTTQVSLSHPELFDIAVDQHTNLAAFSYYNNALKRTEISVRDKKNPKTVTSQIMSVDSNIVPKIQCYKGKIYVWHPKIRKIAGMDIKGEQPSEIIPGEYDKIESIRTSFAQ